MTELFLKVFEMSIMGSVVILVTLLMRFLLRKRSKRLIMIMWAVVAVRLLLPINIGSEISIFNLIPVNISGMNETSEPQEIEYTPEDFIDVQIIEMEDVTVIEKKVSYIEPAGEFAEMAAVYEEPVVSVSETALPDVNTVIAVLWLTGVAGITAYCLLRFIMLKRKLKDARMIDSNVYESGNVKTPFVFGLFIPKIYLPEVLDNREREYILKHERTHLKHGDWIIKIIGMAAVAVHWFNPLVWISYRLLEQDIEMSCDETTVANMDEDMKQAYAISLVNYAARSNSRRYLVTPLGFAKRSIGRSEVKGRVNNIINYKPETKAATVVITLCLLATSAVCGFDSKTVNETKAEDEVIISEVTEEIVAPELLNVSADIEDILLNQEAFYNTGIPLVRVKSDSEKEITFYRDGKAIKGKLMLPQEKGPYKTIVINGSMHSSYYNEIAKRFNAYGYATIQIETVNYLMPDSDKAVLCDEVVDIYAVIDELGYLADVDSANIYLLLHSQSGYISAFTGTYKTGSLKGIILVDPVLSDAQPVTFAIGPDVEITGVVDICSIFSDCDVKTVLIKGEKSRCQQDSLGNGELFVIDGADNLLSGMYGVKMVDEAVLTMNSWN